LGHSRSPRTGGLNPLFEVELNLAAKGSRESARTLYRELKAAILEGRLLAGAKLPPARKSEAYFGVSRNTAVEVYDRLVNERYVFTRRGSGTYVAERMPAPALRLEQQGK
jgi:GntR family transcriptional regulator/MocR family aminotransferase